MLNWFKPKTVYVRRDLTDEERDALVARAKERADASLKSQVDFLNERLKAALHQLAEERVRVETLGNLVMGRTAQKGRHTQPDMADSAPLQPAETKAEAEKPQTDA